MNKRIALVAFFILTTLSAGAVIGAIITQAIANGEIHELEQRVERSDAYVSLVENNLRMCLGLVVDQPAKREI